MSAAREWLIALAACSLGMTVTGLALALLGRFTRLGSARARRLAWLAVSLGFALPLRPTLPAFGLERAVSVRVGLERLSSAAGAGTRAPAGFAARAVPWAELLAALWLAGAACVLAWTAVKHVRLRRAVLRWGTPLEGSAPQGVRVIVSPAAKAPMLIGWLRPVIALPSREMPPREREIVLRHELAHRSHRDIGFRYALLAARALHWFNPFMPLLAREAELACEQACDERTLADAGCTRLEYVEAILGACAPDARRISAVTTDFLGGKRTMKRRIESMYARKAGRLGAWLVAFALVMTLVAPCVLAADGGQVSFHVSEEAASALERILELTLEQIGEPEYAQEAVMLRIASGEFSNELYDVLQTTEGLTQDELDERTRLTLIVASGEILPAMTAMLEKREGGAANLLCAGWYYETLMGYRYAADVSDGLVDANEVSAEAYLFMNNENYVYEGSDSAPASGKEDKNSLYQYTEAEKDALKAEIAAMTRTLAGWSEATNTQIFGDLGVE